MSTSADLEHQPTMQPATHEAPATDVQPEAQPASKLGHASGKPVPPGPRQPAPKARGEKMAKPVPPGSMQPLAKVKARGEGEGASEARHAAARATLELLAPRFGGHSFAGVQVHADELGDARAKAHGAKAVAEGNEIFLAAEVDPASAAGQEVLAHEMTHVVQQTAGSDPTAEPMPFSDAHAANDFEAEAQHVGSQVVAGVTSRPALRTGSSRPQGFVEREHKAIGDEGSGGRKYKFGPLPLTHGDLVMLSGDHFSPEDLTEVLKRPSTAPGMQPNTQDEVLCVLHRELGDRDPRFKKGGIWAGITFSSEVESAIDVRYYKLATQNNQHFAHPHDAGFEFELGRESAGGTYRAMHENAVTKAFKAGKGREDITLAMAAEAMAQHFLTDEFASGHMDTPRLAINDYWNGMYPRFADQLLAKIARDVAAQLAHEATLLSALIPVSTIETKARAMIKDQIGSKPLPTLGDIVALAVHGHDNEAGLWVTNDLGWRWKAHGDGNLEAPTTVAPPQLMARSGGGSALSNRDAAATAVRLGCEDVQRAYDFGKNGGAAAEVLVHIRQYPSAPAVAGPKYAAEQVVPRIDRDAAVDQGQLGWHAPSLADLWIAKIRSNAKETFGEFIAKAMQADGEMGGELVKIKSNLDERLDPFPWYAEAAGGSLMTAHGYLYPQRGFQAAIMDRLADISQALSFLMEVVKL